MKKEFKKPFLAWKKQDFIDNNQEIPSKLIEDDFHTEGELMSNEEILQWISDAEATFCVVREQDEKMFEKLTEEYQRDLEYLAEIGKINKELIPDILNKENFHF